ncbi:MAG: UMP kinase [Candidatus Ancillula sp.]|jgi:uridylate kinase|nr:UMP kinase [Candidatus Ancillula sp.]
MTRRVLLKLSGEAFGAGKVGIDIAVIKRIAGEIKEAVSPTDGQESVQVCIVVGGGNFFRGEELSAAGMDRNRGDYMGMLGTVMNCIALQEFLEQIGVDTRVQTAIAMGQVAEAYIPLKAVRHMQKGRVVVFGAGAGMPYFSTDTVAIQRALEMECECVLMGKNGVDGVYDSDPRKNPNAKKLDHLTYTDALVNNLQVMDAAALSLARTNDMDMRVFGLDGPGNVTKALRGGKFALDDSGKQLGTLVKEGTSVNERV